MGEGVWLKYDVCWLNYDMPEGIDIEILRRREVMHLTLTMVVCIGIMT